MADYNQYGDPNYSFGIQGANLTIVPGMAVTGVNLDKKPEFIAEAKGAQGLVAAAAVAKDEIDFTAEGYLIDKVAFDAAGDFTYDGKFYYIVGRTIEDSNEDFRKCSITAKHKPLISSVVA
jgi:hypothetical protein